MAGKYSTVPKVAGKQNIEKEPGYDKGYESIKSRMKALPEKQRQRKKAREKGRRLFE
jgi:hypothetical protein